MRLLLRRFPARQLLGGLSLFALLCAAALAGPKYFRGDAATITVTSTADSGPGSLRAALAAAGAGDTIQFHPALNGQTISLTSAELAIHTNLTIDGPGSSLLTVSRSSGTFRIFHVLPGHTVTIEGLTIQNGSGTGGGVFNDHATLTINSCVVAGNVAPESQGAGLYNDGSGSSATLTILNSTISGNQALSTQTLVAGGGIANDGSNGGSPTLTIVDSLVDGNVAEYNPPSLGFISEGNGGGIYNNGAGATLAMTNSIVSNNRVGGQPSAAEGGGHGGGIWSSGAVTIRDSTLSGNGAGWGGGISNSAILTIAGSTINNNYSTGYVGSSTFYGDGGGIDNSASGTLTITNSTLNNNASPLFGGALKGFGTITNSTLSANGPCAIYGGGIIQHCTFFDEHSSNNDTILVTGPLEIGNTILRTGFFSHTIHNISGTVTSRGYNLSSDNGGGFLTGPGDRVNTDPLLGPLQDNGGPTFTHNLLPGSPAINAGDPSFAPPPQFDQRGPGYFRLFNGRIDIGSLEAQPTPGPLTVSLPINTFDTSVPIGTVIIQPVLTTNIDASLNYVGFQGDFTYDSTVVSFSSPFVQAAGLTAGGNWNVVGHALPGPGPIRTFRLSAFSLDFTPLSGSGTLFNLRMLRVSSTPGNTSPLVWGPDPDNFLFIDGDLNSIVPDQNNGLITITGTGTPTLTPAPSPTPTATATATPTATAAPSATPTPGSLAVSLPIVTFDASVPVGTGFFKPVLTTNIDASLSYIGFQGDFTYDSTVVTFLSPFVQAAGLTGGGNWNVSANILPGPGPIRTFRFSAFSLDFTPLSGSGTLFNLRMLRVGGTPGTTSPLVWQPAPNNFVFIDSDLNTHVPIQNNGLIIITGAGTPTPPPAPSPTPTATPCGNTVFSENFDGVVAPALPPSWVTANAAGAAPMWVTSTTTPDTAPNDAFIDDPATVSDKLLDTPNIAISSAAAQVSFRNFYFLESTFDGGVLEVSSPNINAGAFTDITAAAVGGSFVTGAYSATISTAFMSPIAGRMAWSGNAEGYISTVANLGPNVAGQTIKLRFRMASDNSVSATGWRVDTIRVADGTCASPTPTAAPSATPTPGPLAVSLPIDTFDTSVPIDTVIIEPVLTTNIDPSLNYIGFQGDFTYDSTVVSFSSPFVQAAGLTAGGNWHVALGLLPGPGPIKTARLSAFSNDFIPLNGSGTLLNLRMVRVSGTPGATSPLVWKPDPDNFIFIDGDLNSITPGQNNGLITITGTGTPTPNPTPSIAPPTHFAVTGPKFVGPGAPFSFTVTAQDQFNNTVPDYAGTVHFTSTDSTAQLPVDSTLLGGTGTFSAALHIVGQQTITATDTSNALTGTSNIIFVLPFEPTPPPTPTIAPPSPTPSCTPGGSPGPWATASIGPPPRYRAGGVTDGTSIYVFGGGNILAGGNEYLNDLWRWTPATQTWTQLANMPTGKQNIQGAYWNGKIYVPGGWIGFDITENAIYDIATNTWSTGAPLPAAQTGTNVAFNNKIYNFGGSPGPQATTTIYDIATNTWTAGAAMPVATYYARAVRVGGFAYYVGGIAGAVTNAVHRYDIAANTWMTMSPLQRARTSAELMASPDGSMLFAVMGGDGGVFTGVPEAQSVEIYNIAGNSWTYGNPVVTRGAAPSGGLAGGKLMVVGGVELDIVFDIVQVSQLPLGCLTPTPTPTSTPTPTTTPTPTPTLTPTSTPTASATPARPLNLSTRMLVQTGDSVGIGGFIITGSAPKRVIVRAIGPSLSNFGVPNPLADPVLELHGPAGFVTVTNDNWRFTREAEIIATGLAPTDDLESAIVANLTPGNYTAIVLGKNNTTGVALVEVYDLDLAAASKLANISTRAFVSTGTDIMIAGFILGAGDSTHVLLRGIGPSLTGSGIIGALADPTLELRDSNGVLLASNDNCGEGSFYPPIFPPPDPAEACIDVSLSTGAFTAILAGKNGGTGIGLVEIYDLN